MLKRRIIPIELFDQGRLVKTINFKSPRDVGDPLKSSQVYSDQDADELILLNITRKRGNKADFVQVLSQISQKCFVPLSVGGAINDLDDAKLFFNAGADKIIINSKLYENTKIITEIANEYGQQAVIACIDVDIDKSNINLFSDCGRKNENIKLEEHLDKIMQAGPGEIMVQSITNDGKMCGYDLALVDTVIKNSNVPVIVAGGAGDFLHLKQALEMGADAVACGSLFNFGDNNPLRAKSYLKNHKILLKNI